MNSPIFSITALKKMGFIQTLKQKLQQNFLSLQIGQSSLEFAVSTQCTPFPQSCVTSYRALLSGLAFHQLFSALHLSFLSVLTTQSSITPSRGKPNIYGMNVWLGSPCTVLPASLQAGWSRHGSIFLCLPVCVYL